LSDIGNSVNRVLSDHNFPIHSKNAYRYFIGDGALTLIERALPEEYTDAKTIQKCHEEFNHDYRQNWNIETSVYDEIAGMLDVLCARGIRLSILSNKPHEFTLKCVKAYLRKWPFEIVFGHQEKIPKKPDPAGAQLIVRQMGISPSEILYLGDSAVDMKTACAAGMFAAGALWGFRTKEELKKNGAKALLNNPIELLSLLDF